MVKNTVTLLYMTTIGNSGRWKGKRTRESKKLENGEKKEKQWKNERSEKPLKF
jgi:hypothetical protein